MVIRRKMMGYENRLCARFWGRHGHGENGWEGNRDAWRLDAGGRDGVQALARQSRRRCTSQLYGIQVGESSVGIFSKNGDGDPASPLQRHNFTKAGQKHNTPSRDQLPAIHKSITEPPHLAETTAGHGASTPNLAVQYRSRDSSCARREYRSRDNCCISGGTTPCGTSPKQKQRQVGATSGHLLKSKRERLCCVWFTCLGNKILIHKPCSLLLLSCTLL